MDKLTILGIFLALVSLVGGSLLKGSGLSGLFNPAAFVIVIVGTFAAIAVHAGAAQFMRAFKVTKWTIFGAPKLDRQQMIELFENWGGIARKEGLISLERQISSINDPFLAKGLQMVVDNIPVSQLREQLEAEIAYSEEADLAGAKVLESMGVYSPTMGIIGAVLGLMATMKNLDDPTKIGAGIAAAFTATIYGIGFANFLMLPLAAKAKTIIADRTADQTMIVEGLCCLSDGLNPRDLVMRLNTYLT